MYVYNLPPHPWFPTCGAKGHHSNVTANIHSVERLNNMSCTSISKVCIWCHSEENVNSFTTVTTSYKLLVCLLDSGRTTLSLLDSMKITVFKQELSHSKSFSTMQQHVTLEISVSHTSLHADPFWLQKTSKEPHILPCKYGACK